jgi:hypothetical protein
MVEILQKIVCGDGTVFHPYKPLKEIKELFDNHCNAIRHFNYSNGFTMTRYGTDLNGWHCIPIEFWATLRGKFQIEPLFQEFHFFAGDEHPISGNEAKKQLAMTLREMKRILASWKQLKDCQMNPDSKYTREQIEDMIEEAPICLERATRYANRILDDYNAIPDQKKLNLFEC